MSSSSGTRRGVAIALLSAGFSSALSACGGGSDSTVTTQPERTDSTSSVVGPAGGLVVTPNGGAGVQIPPGVLGQQVTVTVTRLPTPATPGQGPLPSPLNQYGPFYEIATSPAVPQLSDSVRVGVCQVTDASSQFYAPEASHERLRLAHTVGTTTEILEPVGVDDFLRCTGITASAERSAGGSSRWSRVLASLGNRAIGFFSPASLNAAHGGLGGKVKSFSPFAAVDPLTGLVIGPEFSISATANEDDFGAVAYDGTNYLVATSLSSTQADTVVAQFVSSSGALVGARIVFGVGFSPRVAFDGTNYLIVWATFGGNSFTLLGQFVSKSGAKVGSPFTIAVNNVPTSPNAVLFGGGTYFLSFTRAVNTNPADFEYRTFGRIISTAGTVGPLLALSSGLTNDGFNNTAFDGTNFFTVYNDGTTVRGRFVSAAGVPGQEVTVAAAAPLGSIIAVAFNGTDYLVTVPRGTTGVDAFVQLVSPTGAPIGGVIGVATNSGDDELPVGIVASGSNFLVSYVSGISAVGKVFVRARFVSGAGTVRGPAFTIASPANGKVPAGMIINFNGSKYLELLVRGVQNPAEPGNIDSWTQKDFFGALLTIPIPP